jgi:hypothetical protein
MTDLVKQARPMEVYLLVEDEWTLVPAVMCSSWNRASLPAVDMVTLSLQAGESGGTRYGADQVTMLAVGSEIAVKYADVGEDAGDVFFRGFVVTGNGNLGGDGESATWLCKSALVKLAERFPVGAWSRDYDDFTGDTPIATARTLCTGLVPVFNPEGVGNASIAWWEAESAEVCPLFSPPGDVLLSESWTFASALMYCFDHAWWELSMGSYLMYPSLATLEAIPQLAALPRDVALEGRSWLEVIAELLRLSGCRARERVNGDLEGTLYNRVEVMAIGSGAQSTLLLQAPNAVLDPDLSNTVRMDLAVDGSGLVNSPVVVGGRGEYEGTWPLVPAWGVSLLDPDPDPDDYEARYRSDGDGHLAYRNVGRLWLLNEMGQASGVLYGSQAMFNLTTAVPTDVWARRPRPFERPLSIDAVTRERLPALLEISCDAGAHWQEFGGGHQVLTDSAGVLITTCDLDESDHWSYLTLWEALAYFTAPATMGPVRFRLTASLQADGRIATRPEVPSGCPVLRPIEMLYDRRTSLVKRIRIESGTYLSAYYTAGKDADVRTDITAASAEASAIAAITSALTVHGSATVENVESGYRIGTVITKLQGREISFAAHGTMATPVYAEIVSITEHFGGAYVTEVVLEDMQRAVLAGRPL